MNSHCESTGSSGLTRFRTTFASPCDGTTLSFQKVLVVFKIFLIAPMIDLLHEMQDYLPRRHTPCMTF
jgi:hypothetical protein